MNNIIVKTEICDTLSKGLFCENYDSVDIFKTNKQKDVEVKVNTQELQLVQIKKEGLFRKIINKIKLFLKNN